MGMLAAHSMCNCIDDYAIDTKFELFSHVTRFFGHKVSCMLQCVCPAYMYVRTLLLTVEDATVLFYHCIGDHAGQVQRPGTGGKG